MTSPRVIGFEPRLEVVHGPNSASDDSFLESSIAPVESSIALKAALYASEVTLRRYSEPIPPTPPRAPLQGVLQTL